MTDELMPRLSRLTVSGVSDALDRLGINGQCLGISQVSPGVELTGPAYTVRYAPAGAGGGTVGDFVDDVPPGAVVVIDNAGRMDATVWGDLMTATAASRGLAGTAVDGVCRDVTRSHERAYPMFARGCYMRTGKDRVVLEEVQGAASLGGVRVGPGDALRGGRDGVVAIPSSRISEVIEAAEEIEAVEDSIRTAVAAGSPLAAARRDHGYHTLQSRQK